MGLAPEETASTRPMKRHNAKKAPDKARQAISAAADTTETH
jgi:hypothetical protein